MSPMLDAAEGSEQQCRRLRVCETGDERPRLVKMLRQLNFVVADDEAASTGQTCLASVVSDQVPDAFSLCTQLRSEGPVVMISSDASFGFRLAAARAGVEAVVGRPVNPIELSEWLESFALRRAIGPVSVLVVDDDALVAEVCGAALREAGMSVTTLSDPLAALGAIEATLPDLVLMDMWMPGVDGVELARMVRQSRRFAALPILFLSGERDETRQLAARELGGDDFLVKPVDPFRLVALVRMRAERARQLCRLIERDSLTGVYDHGRFKDRLAHELERCRRTGGELSLAMLDIDRFKAINDNFGHPVGDTVIRALCSVVCGGLRKIDIIGRYGGEEFGIILLDTKPDAAAMVIDKLRERFRDVPFDAAGTNFRVTFSAGVAGSADHAGLLDLIAATDAALYQAKRGGRNRVATAGPTPPHRDRPEGAGLTEDQLVASSRRVSARAPGAASPGSSMVCNEPSGSYFNR